MKAREAARLSLFFFFFFFFLDYFWKEKKALCFNKPFFALFSCFCQSPETIFFFQEARAQ